MAIRITLECGHASVLRGKTTPKGYTHDWELFVRGVDNADISQYIEKVVFQLHETFQKPKRILKEPPYVIKESGYAGFIIPICIYFKNKDEPKKMHIMYDLQLQTSGPAINNVIPYSQTFLNPSDDFKKKLLKGGGAVVSNSDEVHDKHELKTSLGMVGKPKLSGSDNKRHRTVEPKSNNAFADLFGPPIKTAKLSPENKKVSSDKNSYHKTSLDKSDKSDKANKSKHSPHKDSKRDKSEDKKEKKDKDLSKEKERSREKSKRPQSPISNKSNYQSPSSKRSNSPIINNKKSSSTSSTVSTTATATSVTAAAPPPPPPSNSSSIESISSKISSPKYREKDHKKIIADKDKIKDTSSKSSTSDDVKNDKKKKKHKDDKDNERKEKTREKERDKIKNSEIKSSDKKNVEKLDKHDKISDKEKFESKVSKDVKKSPKSSKDNEKCLSKSRSEKTEQSDFKVKDSKSDKSDRKNHKHKKKDKKERTDDSREREKKEKRDKQKSYDKDLNYNANSGNNLPSNNNISHSNDAIHDRGGESSDSANSADEDDSKPLASIKGEPDLVKNPALALMTNSSRLSRPMSPSGSESIKQRDRTDKIKKDKIKSVRSSGGVDDRDSSSRKRKKRSDSKGEDEIPAKREKETSFSPPLEPVSSSQSPVNVEMTTAAAVTATTTTSYPKDHQHNPHHHHHHMQQQQHEDVETNHIKPEFETDSEQIAPDSTNCILVGIENDETVFSDDYVSQLKELQHKIMTLQDNEELQRVVQVIVATGQYEITRKTFDFDLCALDRKTVQHLQQFFSAS